MVFADRRPDKWASSIAARVVSLTFVEPGPTGSPSSLVTFASRRLGLGVDWVYVAAMTTAARRRYNSARVNIAQRERAVLWATAVAATFTGRRRNSSVSHGFGRMSARNAVP